MLVLSFRGKHFEFKLFFRGENILKVNTIFQRSKFEFKLFFRGENIEQVI